MISEEKFSELMLANIEDSYTEGKDLYVLGRTVSNLFISKHFGVVSYNNGILMLKKGEKHNVTETDFHFMFTFNYIYMYDYLKKFFLMINKDIESLLKDAKWLNSREVFQELVEFCLKNDYGIVYDYVPTHYCDTEFTTNYLNKVHKEINEAIEVIEDRYFTRTDTEVLKTL